MKPKYSVTIDENNFKRLYEHLFPGDDDEHGAVLAVGISVSENGCRLLVREIFLAKDGIDYVPGTRGYRALTARFVAEKSDYCADRKLGYLAVHCHNGLNSVSFSPDDLASQKRGYPALLDITGGPVGALVFARNAVAGKIWTIDGVFDLEVMTVVGSQIKKLYPNSKSPQTKSISTLYDRHSRLFGDAGQVVLSQLSVGIVGLGGGGSLLNEWLSKLGIGRIIAIDFDRVETSNLPRIVDATRFDAQTWLTGRKNKVLRKMGKSMSSYKVTVAKRVAKKANPSIHYVALKENILDEKTALILKDVDFIFLASDNFASRNVFNALLHQYLIPGAQVGAKVRVDKKTNEIIEIYSAGRIILPHAGCLYCNGWIPPGRLQEESVDSEQRKKQNYVENPDVHEPSVITLNVLSCAQVVNDLMMMFTGLYPSNKNLPHLFHDVLEREHESMRNRKRPDCLHCGTIQKSMFARGDKGRLPCR